MNAKNRENGYDLLRLVCSIVVIVIHISANYKTAITDDSIFGYVIEKNVMTILLYNTLSRFAVPCFVILSGAFLLSDNRNAEYKFFAKKSVKNVVVPTAVFSILYVLYDEIFACAKIFIKDEPIDVMLSPIKALIKGEPYYHMWYMYMIIGLYLLIPLILQVKNSLSEKVFLKISIILMVITSISGWTSSFQIHWGISKVVCYMGYLMIGYQIRRYSLNNKNNVKAVLFMIFGIIILVGLSFVQYYMRIADVNENYSIVAAGNFNPLVVIASILIFVGFSKLKISCDLSKISSHTFSIYLIHAGVWSVVWLIVRNTIAKGDVRLVIPVFCGVVFGISYILSIAYSKIWMLIEKKYMINERVYKLLHIE